MSRAWWRGSSGPALAALMAVTVVAACSPGPPVVVFDGESCGYQGPDALKVGSIDVTFRNESGAFVALAFLTLPEDEVRRAEALDRVGGDFVITDPDSGDVAGTILAEPGEEVTQKAPLPVGTYLVDCATFEGDQPAHAWRAAAIEVEE